MKWYVTKVVILALSTSLIASAIATAITPRPWSTLISVIAGLVIGQWAFFRIDEYRWRLWFYSGKIPRHERMWP